MTQIYLSPPSDASPYPHA